MAKLALLFIAAFCALQMGMSARIEKRDVADQATEITTESIFDMIKSGIKNTFSDDNISKAKQTIGEFGDKVKNVSTQAYSNIQEGVSNILKKSEVSTVAPAPTPAS